MKSNLNINPQIKYTEVLDFTSFRTDFTDLNLYWIKGALALFVLFSGYVCLIKLLSFRVHSSIVSYRIVTIVQRPILWWPYSNLDSLSVWMYYVCRHSLWAIEREI